MSKKAIPKPVASVPPRQGFTPELPDTGFHRLRAELASHSQSELGIDVKEGDSQARGPVLDLM
jgi:hypothetical protein